MPKKTTNTTRPHVGRLVSNLKTIDGRPRTVELGPKTLIVGPNGSGKSSIQQSLQLALNGSADDLVGRDGVRDNGLLLAHVRRGYRAGAFNLQPIGAAEQTNISLAWAAPVLWIRASV